MPFLATSAVDWSKVSELAFAAILALVVGAVLQWWLLRDQKRFQKGMLDRQLEFMERLERERSERDAKADAERIAADRKIRIREHFLSGISTIAQYDTDSPGCEQAMRLLDYYSSLAFTEDDPELFHLLNTVMTAEIRKKIEDIQAKKQEIYVSAVAARSHIQAMLKDYHMQRKGLVSK